MVSEVFSKAKLSYGYNYVHTIPAGAMNLTAKQLARSDNLLGKNLKLFSIIKISLQIINIMQISK